jgi:hypothetical protein
MHRRGFLASLAALLVAPFVPMPKPGLMFHRDAFALTMEPAQSFARGDIITIENRYVMDPITRRATPYLQQFVVTEVVNAATLTVAVHPRPAGLDPRRVPLELTRPVLVGHTLYDSAHHRRRPYGNAAASLD